ncbi:MAG: hypothetical protein M3042_02240 [Actinomycetota bacterium]|nr:hypothetical protein [Actinomycetota bacterium]
MTAVRRLPVRREMFLDVRGPDRALRITSHPEAGAVVLSIWHGDRCTASFQLPVEDTGRLISALASGLTDQLFENGHQPGKPVGPAAASETA